MSTIWRDIALYDDNVWVYATEMMMMMMMREIP